MWRGKTSSIIAISTLFSGALAELIMWKTSVVVVEAVDNHNSPLLTNFSSNYQFTVFNRYFSDVTAISLWYRSLNLGIIIMVAQ